MHFAIAGNIGAGKTTLTGLLAKHYKWEAHYEDVSDNPYLDDFYANMERWSFNLQVFFLNSRFRQIVDIRQSKKNFIQDRTIYEDAYIFAPNLHAMGLMTERDFCNYRSLFELMESFIQPPDLLIYLRSSIANLVNQIQKRGREYENSISIEYLNRLNQRYEDWIRSYDRGKLLIVEVDNMDFVKNPEDLGEVIQRIDTSIHGLFSEIDKKKDCPEIGSPFSLIYMSEVVDQHTCHIIIILYSPLLGIGLEKGIITILEHLFHRILILTPKLKSFCIVL